MAIGPVQLIVLGFNHPDFHGEIIAELERLRQSDTVRVIDSMAVYKDAAGEIEVEHLSNLTEQEAIELGSKIGALVGLGIAGEEGAEAGAEAGAERAAAEGIDVFDDSDEWDVLEDIPNDSAAALILLEHHWAVPLRDAIARAGGFRLHDMHKVRSMPFENAAVELDDYLAEVGKRLSTLSEELGASLRRHKADITAWSHGLESNQAARLQGCLERSAALEQHVDRCGQIATELDYLSRRIIALEQRPADSGSLPLRKQSK